MKAQNNSWQKHLTKQETYGSFQLPKLLWREETVLLEVINRIKLEEVHFHMQQIIVQKEGIVARYVKRSVKGMIVQVYLTALYEGVTS